MSITRSSFNLAGVIARLEIGQRQRFQLAQLGLVDPGLDFLEALAQVSSGWSQIFSIQPAPEQGYIGRDELGGAARHTQPAHDAVERSVSQGRQVAAQGCRHVAKHIDLLWASFGAGVAAEATQDFRIQVEQGFTGWGELLQAVSRALRREEGDRAEQHSILNNGLAGQGVVQAVIAAQAVDRATRPAESTPAAHAAREMEASPFEGF